MITLVTGGARSGKSSFAQSIFAGVNDVVYIATAQRTDEEMDRRIAAHRASRPHEWRTEERWHDLAGAIQNERGCLLDCITILTSNIMFEITGKMEHIDSGAQKLVEDKVCGEINALILRCREAGANLVMVTNELGSGIVPANHVARVYRDIAGRVNQRTARLSDEVYLCVSGIPVKIK